MADFYWIAGTGNWSDYTNHWRVGGTGGTTPANAPTSADNVFFVDASTAGIFTVTIDVTSTCANFDASGITNAANKMTLTGTAALSVYGSWSNAISTYYARTYTGNITFAATAVGKTITSNAVTITGGDVTFDGIGGEWTLSGALTIGTNAAGSLFVTNGSFKTNSNNLTAFTIQSNNSNIRTIDFGASASTVTLARAASNGTVWDTTTTTNLTFNAGGSSITCGTGTPAFVGGGLTFNDLTFSNSGAGTIALSSSGSYRNLTFTARSTDGVRLISLGGNTTITGTLKIGTIVSSSAVRRILFFSNTLGTQRTFTMNGATSVISAVYDVDFRDVVFTQVNGSTAAFPDDTVRTYRYGDCKNNSGITFSAGVSRYWNLAGSQNWSAVGWATTNTGAPANANFPLAQDTATFTEAGSAGTVTVDNVWNIGSIQMADGLSNRTTAFTLATGTNALSIYGSITLFSSLTLSGTGTLTFAGRGATQIITSAGIVFTQPWAINNVGGIVRLADNTSLGATLATSFTGGTFDINGKIFTTGTFANTGSVTRAITFGTNGNITVAGSGAAAWNSTGSGFTSSGTSATINMSSASAKTFVGNNYAYSATLNQGGAGILTVSGSNTFYDITATSLPSTINFTAGTTQALTQFTASGTAGNLLTLKSSSAGAAFILSDASGTNNVSYCNITDSTTMGGATWNSYTTNGNVNGGGNTGWVFNVPVTYSYSSDIKLRSMAQRGRF